MSIGKFGKAFHAAFGGALIATGLMAAGNASTLDKIDFGSDWVAEAEHGGFYMAKAMGIYEKYGLDVTIHPGGPQVNNPQLVVSGALDIAMLSSAMQPILYTKQDVPLVAVASFYQKSPNALMAHASQGYESLADLKGKPIMVSSYAQDSYWPWLRTKYGYTDDQIRPFSYNISPFLAQNDAIQQAYLTAEPYIAEKAGVEPKVFLLADSGYRDYAALIGVSKKMIEEKPDVIKRFLEASIEGWKEFFEGDPTPAFKMIQKDNPEMEMDVMKNTRKLLQKYEILSAGDAKTMGVGAMTDKRWAEFKDQLVESGMYEEGMNYKDAYTLKFVKELQE